MIERIIPGSKDSNITKDSLDNLCNLLQVMLVKVGHKLDDNTGASIITLLIGIFKTLGTVTENGLIAFSGLVNGLQERTKIDQFG